MLYAAMIDRGGLSGRRLQPRQWRRHPYAGAALSKHKAIDMMSFTGSTAGGYRRQQDAADTVKRVTLELAKVAEHLFADPI